MTEFFTVLIFLTVTLLFIIVLVRFGSLNSAMRRLESELKKVSAELKTLKKSGVAVQLSVKEVKPVEKPKVVTPLAPVVEPVKIVAEPEPAIPVTVAQPVEKITEEIPVVPPVEAVVTDAKVETIEEIVPIQPDEAQKELAEVVAEVEQAATAQVQKTEEKPHPAFVVEKPVHKKPLRQAKAPKEKSNFERFIGENLINKIGIAVLVIGIAFFVKYAVENNWINEIGRVLVGFVCGGILLGFGHKLRKKFRPFSSVLVGGALVVFYFTVGIAFREYGIFSQPVAFILMIAITAFSVLLSVAYDRRELAILSLIGGLLTPFVVSTGTGNYHVLFTYLTILNVGMLVLSMYKRWIELNFIAFVGTMISYWGFYLTADAEVTGQNLWFLLYSALFYVVFMAAALLQALRHEKKMDYLHGGLILLNSFFFYLAGTILLNSFEINYKGIFTIALAVINFIPAYWFYKKRSSETGDKGLLYFFIGLSMTFVSLAAPMQLSGNYITLFWASEIVLLGWLFNKSNERMFFYGSLIVLLLTFISLQMDFGNAVGLNTDTTSPILNSYFVTRIYLVLALFAYRFILKSVQSDVPNKGLINAFSVISLIAGIALLYITGVVEINTFMDYKLGTHVAYGFTYLYILALIVSMKKLTGQKYYAPIALSLAGVSFFVFLFNLISTWGVSSLYHYTSSVYDMPVDSLDVIGADGVFPGLVVFINWLSFVFLLGGIVYAARIYAQKYSYRSGAGNFMSILISVLLLIICSVQVGEVFQQLSIAAGEELEGTSVAITLLWAVLAFLFMIFGMRWKYRTLRVISLILIAVVLFKLLVFDLSNVSQGGRIIAFIGVGVLLLVLSFMYQKLKKILFDDDSPASTDTPAEPEL